MRRPHSGSGRRARDGARLRARGSAPSARRGAARYRSLIEEAKRAQKFAYCPYSRYPVGAAVLTVSGKVFRGANVENASYGLSLCAERVAVFNAVTRGEKELRAVCVVGRKARPCGACRQVMLEFSSKETDLILVDLDSDTRRENVLWTRVSSMLPKAFDPLGAGLLPPNPQNLVRLSRARRPRRGRRRSDRGRKNRPRSRRR